MIRVGIGYDVHRLVEGRNLFLGGVHIPNRYGLEGHSDADVLLHAICDSLLGAAALGDIGKHFPNSSKEFKDISSLILLEKVNSLLKENKFLINNIDATLLAEKPKIIDYVEIMREKISEVLSIDKSLVSIKATTNELLGFVGREEGMAAISISSILKVLNND